MKLTKNALFLCLAIAAGTASAADIEGKWRTIDDATKKPKAIVSITESGGSFSGKIVSLMPGVDPNCNECSGAQKGKPLVGQTVLSGLKAEGGEYTGGKITDPKTGKVYKAKAKVINGGKALEVRGYVGVSLLGRTQTWQRIQ